MLPGARAIFGEAKSHNGGTKKRSPPLTKKDEEVARGRVNAALCAFAVRNYVTSYECMARAVRIDPAAYGSRARCHLRMAEACLGVHEDCKANRRAEGQRLFEEMGRLPLGGDAAAVSFRMYLLSCSSVSNRYATRMSGTFVMRMSLPPASS